MSSESKRKGSLFENQIEQWLLDSGLDAQRLPRAGAKDIGDVHVRIKGDEYLVIECKNVKRVDLNEWIRQSEVESANHQARYGRPTHPLVIHKARGKSIDQARVTMTLGSFVEFLRHREIV